MSDLTISAKPSTPASDVGTPVMDPLLRGDQAALRVRGYWENAWHRLRYDYVTLFFLALILLIILSAVFAPELAPFDPGKASTRKNNVT